MITWRQVGRVAPRAPRAYAKLTTTLDDRAYIKPTPKYSPLLFPLLFPLCALCELCVNSLEFKFIAALALK